jgi:hypothetical protein
MKGTQQSWGQQLTVVQLPTTIGVLSSNTLILPRIKYSKKQLTSTIE